MIRTPAVMIDLDAATADQIERANEAVQFNLVDGEPKFESAQGYACALTAIMLADTRTPAGEMIERNRIAIRNVGAFIVFAADKMGLQQIEDLRIVHGLAESAYNPNDRLREALKAAQPFVENFDPYNAKIAAGQANALALIDAALSHRELYT